MNQAIALLREQLFAALERKARAVDRVRELRNKLHAEMKAEGLATATTTYAVMRAVKELGEVTAADVTPYCGATYQAIWVAMATLCRRGKLVRVRRGVYARAGRKAA